MHGLTGQFLADKPRFAAIAQDMLEFIGDAALVIHNAEFDLKFLNAELRRLDLPGLAHRVVDTLALARRKFPGAQASLDAALAALPPWSGPPEPVTAVSDSNESP